MVRTKQFDPDTALAAALDVFWRQGYEATSIADLVQCLGVNRASLYDTFGSKHELYLRALDRYVEQHDPGIVELLAQPGPVLPAVRELVTRYAEQSAGDTVGRGCLVVNAAVERLPGDDQARRRVHASWDTLEVALVSALVRARAQHELPAERDPRAIARLLLVVLQGLRVMGKGGSQPERLRDAAMLALTLLD